MPCSLRSTKTGVTLGLCLAFIIGAWCGSRSTTAIVYPQSAYEIVKTVSHLTVRNPGFELIASFPDEDVAYYRRVGITATVNIGDTVYTYRGDTAVITDMSVLGFTIRTDLLTIGDSGTVIRNSDGEQVGYVSQQVGDNLYYCIWS